MLHVCLELHNKIIICQQVIFDLYIMSFVIPTAQNLVKYPDIPGPGNYQTEKPKQIKVSCAPFNTSTMRAKKPKKKQISPGPGDYSEVNLKKVYEIENEGSTIFKSKVQRFKEKENTSIGPASYNVDTKRQARNVASSAKKQIINFIRESNNARKTQSIKKPSHYVRIIYNNPNSTQNYLTQYVDTQFMNRNLGPGQYQITNGTNKKRNTAPNWSKSKTKRFKSQDNINDIGPGEYQVQEHKQIQNKQTAAFASQAVRTYFDSLLYKTNHKDVASLRQYIKFKNNQPGPGQYELKKQQESSSNVFQFFGSTTQRFQQSRKNISELGPGSYHIQSLSDKYKKIQPLRRVMTSMSDHNLQEQITPGPAQYDSHLKTLKDELIKKFKTGYHGQFGIREKRFKTQAQNTKMPGPGQYDPLRSLKNTNKFIATSYVAKSRRAESKTEEVPFGNYNIDIYDISKIANKKKQFLENLRKIEVYKPPFESNVQRFKTEIENHNTSLIQNPNIFKQDNLNVLSNTAEDKQVLAIPQKNNKASLVFKSSTRRFQYKIQDNPPPGHYTRNKSIEKQSYNIKYGYKKI